MVARVVAACDRARPPSAADRPRLRARRLEPGLDELHPGPGAPGLAADGGLRAGAGLRRARAGRAGAGRLVHVPPLPRRWRRARRRRWQAASSSASAPTRPPRRSTTSISRSCSRSRWPASSSRRYLRGSLSDRRFVVLFALCVAGVFATFLETLFWATLGGALALGLGIAFARGSERARLVRCLALASLAYGIALVVAAPYLWVALAHPDPLGISGRGFELDLANLLVPTRVTALRPSVAPSPRRAARRQQPDRAARLRRARAPGDRGLRALGAPASAARARACDHDRRRDRARARLAPRRGRASHLARSCRGRSSTACRSRAMRCPPGPSCSCGLRWRWSSRCSSRAAAACAGSPSA